MPENSKLQPAKLGKNFDPVDHSNRNFFFSLILSVLLHWLIYFLFEHREDFFPSKSKLVKLTPDHLLVLKRGHSQDTTQNTRTLYPSEATADSAILTIGATRHSPRRNTDERCQDTPQKTKDTAR
ncbi:hypothetical protein JP0009_14230 [Helicobacter pylori]